MPQFWHQGESTKGRRIGGREETVRLCRARQAQAVAGSGLPGNSVPGRNVARQARPACGCGAPRTGGIPAGRRPAGTLHPALVSFLLIKDMGRARP